MTDMLRSRAEELKGKKTRENLYTAFAGESQARNKYTFFAAKARAEGYNQIADLFEETAHNERAHAKMCPQLAHCQMASPSEEKTSPFSTSFSSFL